MIPCTICAFGDILVVPLAFVGIVTVLLVVLVGIVLLIVVFVVVEVG